MFKIMKNTPSNQQSNDYENSHHIAKKLKNLAVAQQFKKKNPKDIKELVDMEDDDFEEYARYIK